jgi:hypothetical protein
MEVITVSSPLTKNVSLQSVVVTAHALASEVTKQLTEASPIAKTLTVCSYIDLEEYCG